MRMSRLSMIVREKKAEYDDLCNIQIQIDFKGVTFRKCAGNITIPPKTGSTVMKSYFVGQKALSASLRASS